MGIGLANGTHQGWDNSDIVVWNVFDPGANWGEEGTVPDPAGLGLVGLAMLARKRRR